MIVLNPLSMVETMATATHKVQFYVFFTGNFSLLFSATPNSYYYLFIFFFLFYFLPTLFSALFFLTHTLPISLVVFDVAAAAYCQSTTALRFLFFSVTFLYIHLLHFSVFDSYAWSVFFFAFASVMIVSVLLCAGMDAK